jgi:hypothetical protein
LIEDRLFTSHEGTEAGVRLIDGGFSDGGRILSQSVALRPQDSSTKARKQVVDGRERCSQLEAQAIWLNNQPLAAPTSQSFQQRSNYARMMPRSPQTIRDEVPPGLYLLKEGNYNGIISNLDSLQRMRYATVPPRQTLYGASWSRDEAWRLANLMKPW